MVPDWKDAVRIAIQICSAIEHAHSKQIIQGYKPRIFYDTRRNCKSYRFWNCRAVTSSTISMVGAQ